MKTEIKAQHTATPWRISGGMVDGYNLVNESDNVTNWNSSYPINKANMEFIIQAVNSHEKLIELSKSMIQIVKTYNPSGNYQEWLKIIAKAEEKEAT